MRPRPFVGLLARVEEKLRVRLHQAANRMEDADPIDVGLARTGVRALDVVDRLTGFREEHRKGARIPAGERRPLPVPEAERHPELADLDRARLTPKHRARLRQAYRAWEHRLLAAAKKPLRTDAPGAGHPLPDAVIADLEPLWAAWQAEIATVRSEISP